MPKPKPKPQREYSAQLPQATFRLLIFNQSCCFHFSKAEQKGRGMEWVMEKIQFHILYHFFHMHNECFQRANKRSSFHRLNHFQSNSFRMNICMKD